MWVLFTNNNEQFGIKMVYKMKRYLGAISANHLINNFLKASEAFQFP